MKNNSILNSLSDQQTRRIMNILDILLAVDVFILPLFGGPEVFARRLLSFVLFTSWTVLAFFWRNRLRYSKWLLWFMAFVSLITLVSLFIPGGVLFPQIKQALDPYL